MLIRHHHQAREKMEVQMETHLPFFRNLKKDCISAWFYAPEPQISNVETIIALNNFKEKKIFFWVWVFFMVEVGSCYLNLTFIWKVGENSNQEKILFG